MVAIIDIQGKSNRRQCKQNVAFAISITCADDELSKKMEPGVVVGKLLTLSGISCNIGTKT
jgi:hypothetical protein